MSTITVLCPNGRREIIKVQQSTKILEIIDEACKKQGLDPNEHDAIFQRRRLDIASTLRLAGVPNNAMFELKKLDIPRKFEDVTIALQLEDGSRLNPHQFSPNTYLYEIIEQFSKFSDILKNSISESQGNNFHSVCSYMNEQIVGIYQLKNTSLKDLGLTNGRGVIRYSIKHLEVQDFEKLNIEFRSKIEKKLKLEESFKIKQQLASEKSEKNPTITQECSLNAPEFSYERQNEKRQRIDEKIEINKKQEYEKKVTNQSSILIEENFESKTINEFANFKFPEETKGKKLNDINELQQIEQLSKEACERQPILYSIDKMTENSRESNKNDQDLPEDFFDITVNDLKFVLSDLKKVQSEDQPLMTKAMRELEQDKKAMKYAQVVIRIAFKNRQVLQGFFRPKENISVLYSFVKENLSKENSVEDMDFYLFQTPPKVILNNMKKNLFESNLCPASLIHFKNVSDKDPILKKELTENLKTIEEANELVRLNVHEQMRDIKHEGLDWMEREQNLVKNMIKPINLTTNPSFDRFERSQTSQQHSNVADNKSEVNKKLERFLKGSKK